MKKRLEELDVLRAIGCIAVIIIHVTASTLIRYRPHSLHLKLAYIANTFTKFAVPLFVFISGVVLMYSYQNKPFEFKRFMKARAKSIGIPYLAWNLFYYIIFVLLGTYYLSPLFFVKQLLLGSMVYHFYFVVIIFQFYLLSNLWLYCFRRFNPTILMLFSGVISLLSIKYIYFKFSDRFFLNYLIFFILGCYIVTIKDKAMERLYRHRGAFYMLALLTGGLLTQQLYQAKINRIRPLPIIDYLWPVYSILAIIALYLAATALLKKYRGILKSLRPIGDASFYIYLSHPFFLMISIFIVRRLNIISITLDTIFNLSFVMMTSISLGVLYIKKEACLNRIKLLLKT